MGWSTSPPLLQLYMSISHGQVYTGNDVKRVYQIEQRPVPEDLWPRKLMLRTGDSSLPSNGSLLDSELASHNVPDCGKDVGKVMERLEGDVLVLTICDQI